MPPLKLVPPAEPNPKQATVERVKKMARSDGLLQCPRCGGRAMITQILAGSIVRNGRRQGGTEIEKEVCLECYKRGIRIQMVTEIKPVT